MSAILPGLVEGDPVLLGPKQHAFLMKKAKLKWVMGTEVGNASGDIRTSGFFCFQDGACCNKVHLKAVLEPTALLRNSVQAFKLFRTLIQGRW